MTTDTRRETVAGERDLSAPAALAFGAVLVIVGLGGFFALGSGVLLGLFQVSMPLNIVHLGVGTVLFSAAILGARPARIACFGAALILLALAVAGLAGNEAVAPNAADTTLDLTLGLVLLAIGRLAPR
jgi:hypothetical protein